MFKKMIKEIINDFNWLWASNEEAETGRDEAGPSTAEASSSRPHKLRTRRPRASSPIQPEVGGGDGGDLDLGAVPSPPRRACTAIELTELGQVRLFYVFLAFIKLLCLIFIKLLMFLMFSFMSDAIAKPGALQLGGLAWDVHLSPRITAGEACEDGLRPFLGDSTFWDPPQTLGLLGREVQQQFWQLHPSCGWDDDHLGGCG